MLVGRLVVRLVDRWAEKRALLLVYCLVGWMVELMVWWTGAHSAVRWVC